MLQKKNNTTESKLALGLESRETNTLPELTNISFKFNEAKYQVLINKRCRFKPLQDGRGGGVLL